MSLAEIDYKLGHSGRWLLLQAANEEFAFVDEFLGKMIVQVEEKILMPNNSALE
jgi:hypothetical protein